MTQYQQSPYFLTELSHDQASNFTDIVATSFATLPTKNQLVCRGFNSLKGVYEDFRIDVPKSMRPLRLNEVLSRPQSLSFNHCNQRYGSYEWDVSFESMPEGFNQANEEYGYHDDLDDYDGGLNSALVTGDEDTASITFSSLHSDSGNDYGNDSLNSMLLS